jgi:hypothetical protein
MVGLFLYPAYSGAGHRHIHIITRSGRRRINGTSSAPLKSTVSNITGDLLFLFIYFYL